MRLDDVRSFFGFTGLTPESDPNNYSFLCPDSHLQPLTVRNPCSWINKPWPVLAAKRTHAEKVQELFRDIDLSKSWHQALLQLLESYHVNITSLDYPVTIDDYLDKSPGYQSAHSWPLCYPPRQIVYCTTTLIEFSKCSWLQEVSTVYAIEPNLQCIRGESLFRCLDDVAKGVADLVLVDQDTRLESEKKFNLTSLVYEFSTSFEQNYVVIAVVKADSSISNFAGNKQSFMTLYIFSNFLLQFVFEDLRGSKACFPALGGAAFSAVTETLNNLKLIEGNCSSTVKSFFSQKSCFGDRDSRYCKESFVGDVGPLKCLKDFGDVAFMNMETFKNLTGKFLSGFDF